VLLQNTIKHLFPAELGRRRREQRALVAEARFSARGERGGCHARGFEKLRACKADETKWVKLPVLGAHGTRSLVLDDADQCRRVTLALRFAKAGCAHGHRLRRVCLDDKLVMSVFVLNVEEDEAGEADEESLPFHVDCSSSAFEDGEKHSDDHLVMRTHVASLQVSVALPDFSWEGTVTSVSGVASLTLPFGGYPGECMVAVRDTLSTAEIRVKIPVAPMGGGRTKRGVGSDGSSEGNSSEEEDEDLDEFEDDGFVVDEDDEHADEGGDEEEECGSSGRGDPNRASAAQGDTCGVCGGGTLECETPVLICECCEGEAHLSCSGLGQVPPDSWYCQVCDGSAWQQDNNELDRGRVEIPNGQVKRGQCEDVDRADSSIDDSPLPAKKRTGKKRSGVAADSDEED